MTQTRFYELLAASRKRLKWGSQGNYGMCIRAVPRKENNKNRGACFCPVTAVYYMETGKVENECDFDECAKDMKLNEKFANTIAEIADDPSDKTWHPKMRRHLLETVGVKV